MTPGADMIHPKVPHKQTASAIPCARRRRVLSQGRVSIEVTVGTPRHHSVCVFGRKDAVVTSDGRRGEEELQQIRLETESGKPGVKSPSLRVFQPKLPAHCCSANLCGAQTPLTTAACHHCHGGETHPGRA